MAFIVSRAEKLKRNQSFSKQQLRYKIQASLPNVTISSIEYVNDKYHHAAFQIKKAEYQRRTGLVCAVEQLFHATASHNVASILKNNLDWRRVTRCKYGIGVSFSDDPNYANKFCNNQNGDYRAFIVCDVLIGNVKHVRDNHDSYPQYNLFDSYRSNTKRVLVKFEDFTFHPTFVVYYTITSSVPRPRLRYVVDDSDDLYDLICGFDDFYF